MLSVFVNCVIIVKCFVDIYVRFFWVCFVVLLLLLWCLWVVYVYFGSSFVFRGVDSSSEFAFFCFLLVVC